MVHLQTGASIRRSSTGAGCLCTRPSHGFRKSPQGSQHDLGITETAWNSSWAFLGRSPPRNVCTTRTISPRFSNPARIKGRYTKCDTSGLVAIKTCAPGTRTGNRSSAKRSKNASRRLLSPSFNTVKRGKGLRVELSNAGGMRQTPPRPSRNFRSWSGRYSTNPYGGSVTTAWIELRSASCNQSKASP